MSWLVRRGDAYYAQHIGRGPSEWTRDINYAWKFVKERTAQERAAKEGDGAYTELYRRCAVVLRV